MTEGIKAREYVNLNRLIKKYTENNKPALVIFYRRRLALAHLLDFGRTKELPKDEIETLFSMVKSSDPGNLIVAESVIEQIKRKINGHTE